LYLLGLEMTEYPEIVQQFQSDYKSSSQQASQDYRKALLKYPLNNQDQYGGTITFRARQAEYKPLSGVAKNLLQETPFEIDDETRANAAVLSGVEDAKSSVVASREDLGPQRKRKCVLYLPSAIQIQDRVSYTNFDLGIIGAGIEAGISSGQSAAQLGAGALSNIAESLKSVAGLFTGTATNVEGEETLTSVAALRLTGGRFSGAIQSAAGVALNPNKRAILSGPDLRNFSFSFKLIPTSQAEAESIKAIVQFFREEMYPEAVEQFGVSAAYRYPSIFDIILRYRTAAGDYKKVATKILPCFLNSVDVNYNQSGMAFHRDGNPQELTLSLNFTEERALNKFDVAVGGY